MHDDLKTIRFATIVCVLCSLCLAAVYSAMSPQQERNKALDVKMKVLKGFGVKLTDESGKKPLPAAEIERIFKTQVEGRVLDSEGRVLDMKVESLTPDQINERHKDHGNLKSFYPYFIFTDAVTGRKKYAIHVSGMGLWSVVKGYIALEDDMETIAGIAIYDHGETPGLGGEIDKPWFQEQFIGKKLAQHGAVKYFRVLKPGEKVDESSVRGISGSTMTGSGLTVFINSDYGVYHKHFASLMKKEG